MARKKNSCPFAIGDRVVCIDPGHYYNLGMDNAPGRVVHVPIESNIDGQYNVGIEFDDPVAYNHGCDGLAKPKHSAWVYDNYLEHEAPPYDPMDLSMLL